MVQPTELAENNRKGDEMNYIVGFIFVVLVAIILRQRHQFEKMRQSARFMSYYAKLNENAKLHAEYNTEIKETLLRMQGYDINRMVYGDASRAIVSEEDKQAMALEVEQCGQKLEEQDKYFAQEKIKYQMEEAE
ncbi:hypothetical protein J6K93_06005 [Leuconostoc mesenteroides]|uniref:hypothetical protein n=1 Tax=Leuconostoc mesenteroides TaxID=1245 RepID=UPI001CBF34F0|nr:hypothetical protein [Leuconostoc mesenteroides]MBZ1510729.1 hypothetical protein [Leuconostoc mesenteroides]